MKHIFLVVIGLSLLACGGGPKRLSRKGYCFNSVDQYGDFVKYDPIPLMIDNPSYKFAEFKTSEETPDDSRAVTLEDGEYVFVVAEIFYEKFDPAIKAKNKYVRMHLQRLRKPDKDSDISNDTRQMANKCVSNLPQQKALGPFSVEAITDFAVDGGKTIKTLEVENYLFSFDGTQILSEATAQDGKLNKAPKSFYKDSEMEFQLYSHEGGDYSHELRSVAQLEDGGTIHVAIRYKFIPASK